MNILSIKNLSFNYPNNKILKDINIHVDKGEVVSILGGSGVGKTTLFNIIAGINPLQSGEISIKGNTDYKGRVSYMLQKDLLLEHKTIIQNITLPLLIRKVSKKEAEEEAIKPFIWDFSSSKFSDHIVETNKNRKLNKHGQTTFHRTSSFFFEKFHSFFREFFRIIFIFLLNFLHFRLDI